MQSVPCGRGTPHRCRPVESPAVHPDATGQLRRAPAPYRSSGGCRRAANCRCWSSVVSSAPRLVDVAQHAERRTDGRRSRRYPSARARRSDRRSDADRIGSAARRDDHPVLSHQPFAEQSPLRPRRPFSGSNRLRRRSYCRRGDHRDTRSPSALTWRRNSTSAGAVRLASAKPSDRRHPLALGIVVAPLRSALVSAASARLFLGRSATGADGRGAGRNQGEAGETSAHRGAP